MKDNFTDINNDLLIKYLLDEASSREVKRVENWLAANDANQQYYDHFRLIWEQSRQYQAPGTITGDAAWKRFQQRIHNQVPGSVPPRASVKSFAWMRTAAVFILLVGGTWLFLRFLNDDPVRIIALQSGEKSKKDTLPDGSVITLNKNSRVSYPEKFAGKTRKITMEGEAFFNVSPDKEKPFIIEVNDLSVRVVGTTFNIKTVNGNTEVIVETGIVQVIKKSHSIRLTPKEKITVNKADSVLIKQPVTDSLYNYFRTKKFYCENTALWKLVQVLNEEYNVNIFIARKELRTLPLTTVFDDEPLDKILAIISETLNISVTRSGNQIILK